MIPLMKHAFYREKETRDALAAFILTGQQLSMGSQCLQFEKAFAEKQGSRHAILFNSGGSANLALVQAYKNLGLLKNGDRVGFSALTWSTNVFPLIQLGLIPVAIDCDPRFLNVTSETLQERIKQVDLQALFLTNALGFVGDIDKITALCKEKNILFFEDNCESLGTEIAGKKTGTFGHAATFSFFVAHHMSTIEGGMICTDDEKLSEMLHMVRANGWDRNLSPDKRHAIRLQFKIASEFFAKYTFYDLAFNLRPTEITGVLGLAQLGFLDENISTRGKLYNSIEKAMSTNPDLQPAVRQHIARLSPFATPIICKTTKLRDFYRDQFAGAGIEIRPMIAGNMQDQPFYKKYVKDAYTLKGTQFIHENGFYCGIYPELNESELETIMGCVYRF